MKEWFRKQLVTIKRNPSIIPLVVMCITCLIFNLKLTAYSKTISLINEPGMGLCSFVITLCSFLSIVTYLGAYPRRQKPKIGSIIITCVMIAASIGAQFLFSYFITYGTVLKENPIQITEARSYVNVAASNSRLHIIFLAITLLLIVTLPLYKKLLAKINTSVELAENNLDKVEVDKEIE